MLIDIKTLSRSTGASLTIETEISLNELTFSNQDYRLTRPPTIRGLLENTGAGILTLTGNLTASCEVDCARCLTPVVYELEIPIAEAFRPQASEQTEEDDDSYRYSAGQLDIGQTIRDNLLTAIPPKLLCREDCQGLCPDCGSNLNEKDCGCAATREGKDSPFEQLKQLL